ncbi:HesA/MoeB/ThiF family protein [Leptospira ilyithenensis]|uniref:HesA/MoeB/ThiF family protein n=1 Tax=Leptospira ilyithenensis TaxID=2484901 RepID=A0A4R9LM62_9LEPT|nr:HesA/MoeB/ThiF family protein [Leptospira ilyithenensis]TGN07090.1 HesA/MoeB/ThiF family protein [Leptospira ilyithenensis]
MKRYDRQTILPEVGLQGQLKLGAARVLVIGAGGLGSALLPALAGAGVGYLRIYDADFVKENNLHRQTMYRVSDIGAFKVECAKATLMQLNPDCKIDVYAERISASNVEQTLDGIDVVVDAADNFAATYVLSDACKIRKIALISSSVIGRKGYVGGFCMGAPSYRALFPFLPKADGNCNTQGVMGPVVAALGAVQAQMALNTLLCLAPSPLGLLVSFDFASWRFTHFRFDHAEEPTSAEFFPFIDRYGLDPNDCVVDLRSHEEAPENLRADVLRIAPQDLANWEPSRRQQRVVFVCKSGIRATQAAYQLQARGYTSLAILAADL